MKTIIEKIYLGELHPEEESKLLLEQYKKTSEQLDLIEDKLYVYLTEEQKRILQEYIDKHLSLSQIELSRAFYQGFQIAVKIILQSLG